MQEIVTFAENESCKSLTENKNYREIRHQCHYTSKYRGRPHSICNLKFNVPNEITTVFDNGSNYHYHFIIKNISKQAYWEIRLS